MKKNVFLIFLSIFISTYLNSQVLNVKEVFQEQTQWCWAAVSQCMLDYHGDSVAQCDIAEYTRTVEQYSSNSYGNNNCCSSPSTCNNPNYLYGQNGVQGMPGSIQDILMHFGNLTSNPKLSYLTQTEITNNIQQNRPFVIYWSWGMGGHFIVGHGIQGNNIYYMDPWVGEGKKIADYSYVLNVNNSGNNNTWYRTLVLTNGSCNTPTGLNTTSVTAISAKLVWDSIPGVDNYNVQYKASGSNNWTNVISNKTSLHLLATLLPSTTYEFHVQSVCSCGMSCYSASSTFTTLPSTSANCGTPVNPTTSSITSSSAIINWSPVPGALDYIIEYNKTSLTPNILYSSTNSSTITGLSPSVSYHYKVKAVCSSKVSNYSLTNYFTTAPDSCEIPNGFNVSDITGTSATINWNPVTSAVSYNIQYKKATANLWTTISSNTNYCIINLLEPTTVYEYKVQTLCSSGQSIFSNKLTFYTSTLCETPSDLTATASDANTALLQWTPVPDVYKYNIRYKKLSDNSWTKDTSITNTKIIDGLTANTTYVFQAQTICSFTGLSNFSNSDTLTITSSLMNCGIPTDLTVYNITNNSAKIEWTAVTDAVSYDIRYRKSGASSWTSTTSSTNYKLINGLVTNAIYEYQVQAICSTGQSNYSQSFNFTVTNNNSCGIPEGLKVTPFVTTAIIEWTTVSGATEYNVQYRKLGEVIWTNVTTYVNSIEINGLTTLTTYEYKVQAICPVEASAYSYLYTFSTLSGISCADNYEPNNQISDATAIPVYNNISGMLQTPSDIDYYKFSNTSAQKNIKITLSDLPYDYDIELLNSSGITLLMSQNSGTTDETIVYNNGNVGDYFIKIDGYNNAYSSTECYTLIVNIGNSNYKITHTDENGVPEKEALTIYPNPAIDKLNLSYNAKNEGSVKVKLFDITGRIVSFNDFNVTNGINTLSIDLNNICKGLYIVELANEKNKIISKIIIDK